MIKRSAAVAIAVTLQQLVSGKTTGWTDDQELVLRALRRSKNSLNLASDEELGEYVRNLSPEQFRGVASNVKGIFHEMLVAQAANTDGEPVTAALIEQTNYPGADVEFFLDGKVIESVQVKAVQDPAAIIEHFRRYPDIDVIATSEVYEKLADEFGERLADSEFSNSDITEQTRTTLEELAGEDLSEVFQDGVLTSVLVGGAIQAKAVLSGEPLDARQIRSSLEMVGIGAAAAMTVDTLLNLI